jgi:hypothetical protein
MQVTRNLIFYMSEQEQIKKYIASQPEPKIKNKICGIVPASLR